MLILDGKLSLDYMKTMFLEIGIQTLELILDVAVPFLQTEHTMKVFLRIYGGVIVGIARESYTLNKLLLKEIIKFRFMVLKDVVMVYKKFK